jgi:hypothetical protein
VGETSGSRLKPARGVVDFQTDGTGAEIDGADVADRVGGERVVEGEELGAIDGPRGFGGAVGLVENHQRAGAGPEIQFRGTHDDPPRGLARFGGGFFAEELHIAIGGRRALR